MVANKRCSSEETKQKSDVCAGECLALRVLPSAMAAIVLKSCDTDDFVSEDRMWSLDLVGAFHHPS